jgi:hypothetical protein
VVGRGQMEWTGQVLTRESSRNMVAELVMMESAGMAVDDWPD